MGIPPSDFAARLADDQPIVIPLGQYLAHTDDATHQKLADHLTVNVLAADPVDAVPAATDDGPDNSGAPEAANGNSDTVPIDPATTKADQAALHGPEVPAGLPDHRNPLSDDTVPVMGQNTGSLLTTNRDGSQTENPLETSVHETAAVDHDSASTSTSDVNSDGNTDAPDKWSKESEFDDPSNDPSNRAYFHPELSREKQEEIIAMGQYNRPDPSDYLTPAFIKNHLTPFRHGIVRATTVQKIMKYNSAGGESAFAVSFEGLVELLIRSKGEPGRTERFLALDQGALTRGDAVVAIVSSNNVSAVRIPSGNEDGANADWQVGGYSKFGIPEAVTDLRNKPFTLAKLDDVMKWVESRDFPSSKPKLSSEDIMDLMEWLKK